jgi:RNA polymerase sigma-70 factor (ECF subfamily)
LSDSTASSTDSSSLSLVAGLCGGSDDAWCKLVDLYAPLVRSWCLYSGVPEQRVADLLQEVFLAIHRSVDRFESQESTSGFRGWVWMITTNKIRDHFRAAGNQPQAMGGSAAMNLFQQVAEVELSDDAPSQQSDTASLLHRALAMVRVEFQARTWDAFWRATVLGQSTAQIADELGVSTASVRQAKSRVLRRLRQQLGDLG